MILKSIISFLTFILEGLAKIVMFLLSALGLWIPAVYTLVFVIVCAVMGVEFQSALGLFYFGLCLTCLLSLWIAVAQVLKAKKKKELNKRDKTENIAKIELKEQPANVAPEQIAPQGSFAPQNQNAFPQQNQGAFVQQPYPNPYPPQAYPSQPYPPQYVQPQQNLPPQNNGVNGYGEQSLYSRMSMENANNSFQSYYNANNAYSAQEVYGGTAQQTMPVTPKESPVVYRSRTEPNLIIHEYSDRLVYFRKTESGFEPDGTEFKQTDGQY